VPYVFTVNTQTLQMASVRGNQPVPAASVIKLPILASLFTHINRNTLNPNTTQWRYDDIHRASGSGNLQYLKPGQQFTVNQLAEKMIQISDNTATNIIIDHLGGMETLNTQWQNWGLAPTRLTNWLPDLRGTNTITCQQMAQVLYNLTLPQGWLPPEQKQAMLRILKGTVNRKLLVAGVPAGTPVAHKTGDIGLVIGDVGIVDVGTQQVIVCIMVQRPRNHPLGRAWVQQAMTTIYQHTLASQTPPPHQASPSAEPDTLPADDNATPISRQTPLPTTPKAL
jgi:beta-lactamase class A